jgi:hypothetical protein
MSTAKKSKRSTKPKPTTKRKLAKAAKRKKRPATKPRAQKGRVSKKAPAKLKRTTRKSTARKLTRAAKQRPARKPARAAKRPGPSKPRAAKKAPARKPARPARKTTMTRKPAAKRPAKKAAAQRKPTPKLDLFKLYRDDYTTPATPVIVELKPGKYLATEGQGAPGGDAFRAQIGALYGVAYTIKMSRKAEGLSDYAIGALEALWWHDHPGADFKDVPLEEMRWQLLIRTPEFITPSDLTAAIAKVVERKQDENAHCVQLITLAEGTCAQMLHVGPYETETVTIADMIAFAAGEGFEVSGRHHEIYLSDPNRVAPEKLRTILRLPIRRKPV